MYWRQWSWVQWLPNTKFFHLTLIDRWRHNCITRLQSSIRVWITEEGDIICEFKDFLALVFTLSHDVSWEDVLDCVPSQITPEDNASLMRVVPFVEVSTRVHKLGGSKAPRPDKFPGLFFQRYWDVVCQVVFAMICSFVDTNTFPYNLTYINIVLIPKVQNPSSLGLFRPISLCKFAYKVIYPRIWRIQGL